MTGRCLNELFSLSSMYVSIEAVFIVASLLLEGVSAQDWMVIPGLFLMSSLLAPLGHSILVFCMA